MLQKLKMRLGREAFHPSWLGVVISPVYIVRRGLHKAILDLSPAFSGSILDLGCGTKPYEPLFTKARSYIGVDIEVSGHDHADSKVDIFYDGKTLPFLTESFDCIVSFEVFEHVFNIEEVLAEVLRVLKPGGRFLLTIPFAWEEHEVPYDFARYTSYGIEHVLRRAGFDCVLTVKSSTAVLAMSQLFIAYLTRYVSPQTRFFAIAFQLLVIFPLNFATLLLNAVLPKQYGFYCNCVVVCEKNA